MTNRICELLHIRYPIIQAPMNWVSGADLAAAVSNAGGLGTLGPNAGAQEIIRDVSATGEHMREQIRKVRRLTDAPFAVNIVIGLGEDQKYAEKIVEVIIEEKVPAAIVSVGRPEQYTERLKAAGIKVMHAISTVRHARKAEAAGVDAVICEGFEAGGHKGLTELTTFALTPMAADARGVIAAMALGADAVYIGTRFMATRESESHENVKTAVADCADVCTTSVSKGFMIARDLKNRFTEQYNELQQSGASTEEIVNFLNEHGQYHSQHLGRAEDAEICCGQGAGLIQDIPGAADVMNQITRDVLTRFEALKKDLEVF